MSIWVWLHGSPTLACMTHVCACCPAKKSWHTHSIDDWCHSLVATWLQWMILVSAKTVLLYWGSSYISNGSHTFSNLKFKDIWRTFQGLLNIFQGPFLCVLKKWFEDYKNKLRPEGMKNGNFGVFTKVEPAMSSHSYEQPTCYGRPLGHSPK